MGFDTTFLDGSSFRASLVLNSRISALNSFPDGSKVHHRLITLIRFRWRMFSFSASHSAKSWLVLLFISQSLAKKKEQKIQQRQALNMLPLDATKTEPLHRPFQSKTTSDCE